ncbi:phosphoribosyltransferase family protein [Neolewinella lacunae]|uniref:ComF family protein n=1 Tax=Neolewinella lacunae TaxID=1517758 RepID=A0A923PPB9_9BACT|nr:phosphoribosyltransferase family protein [Neolewinella lacunae]MBC6994222.1 ComF family protein [Neolewinella lacunae]MDN3634619.1 phosphoribosyltransferase family protein [Neolewinella lacunae]
MSIRQTATETGYGLGALLFPTLCLNCQRTIPGGQRTPLCLPCFSDLAPTNYWELPENRVTDKFQGRLELQLGVALYFFNVGSVCQTLMHALKYYQRPEIGDELGRQLGNYLRNHPSLHDLAGVVPVPIHPRRLHQRGYNQAERIASGVASVLRVPVFPQALTRTDFKGSQTKMDRLQRVENVRNSFRPGRGNHAGQHLLLVDDVVTTGATLDFCGNLLLEHHANATLSIATLAIAE